MSGWIKSPFHNCHEKGRRKIYALDDGGFVISENETWIPGSYASFEAAERAFEMSDKELLAIHNRKNDEAGGVGGVITLEDIAQAEEKQE